MSKTLRALGINCTLKSTPAASSTQKILDQLLQELQSHEVETSFVRVVDHDVKPGVKTDEGEGDAWPALRKQVLDANILVFATPIWMGQPSSVAKRVLERMDAFLGEIDEHGYYPTFGRVAIDVPPLLSSTAVWSPIPHPKEIGRKASLYLPGEPCSRSACARADDQEVVRIEAKMLGLEMDISNAGIGQDRRDAADEQLRQPVRRDVLLEEDALAARGDRA